MSQDILIQSPLSLSAIIDGTQGCEIKPRITRSNSLLQILYDCMKTIVAADAEGFRDVSMDFLKYNRFIDEDINRQVQDFLFDLGFSISTESLASRAELSVKIKWPNKETILRLVHFVIDKITIEELFKC